MAIYLLSVDPLSRSDGRNAIAAAAYRAGEKLRDTLDFFTKQARVHDYTRKGGVVASGILLPDGAPTELSDRTTLWNTVERTEKRKDSRVAREILIALPHELSPAQRKAATMELVNHVVKTYGVAADYAIHQPCSHGKADQRNHHAHVLFTTRTVTEQGLSPKVSQAFNDKGQGSEDIEDLREAWETICNNALEAAGRPERVSRHTLLAQGIDRLPEPKQGPIATQMEREGRTSHAGEDRRATKDLNEALNQIPDEEEDIEEPDDDAPPPIRRKREVKDAKAAIKTARKHNRAVAAVLYRRGLELLRRLEQQRRRRQELLRLRMQRLTRSLLVNTWLKANGLNSQNQHTAQHQTRHTPQQANAPPVTTEDTMEGYSEAEILAALAARGFDME